MIHKTVKLKDAKINKKELTESLEDFLDASGLINQT